MATGIGADHRNTAARNVATPARRPSVSPWPGVAALSRGNVDPDVYSGVRRIGLYFLLAILFLYYTKLHEQLSAHIGSDARLLYIFSIPALAAMVMSGGLRRAFSAPAVRYWLLFVVWMVVATPFSTWHRGSLEALSTFVRTCISIMLLMAGLPMTWKDCRLVLTTIGLAGIVSIGSSHFLGQSFGHDRLGVDSGAIGNPNDYAGHLLMILPFVIWLILNPPRMMGLKVTVRVAGLAAVFYGVYLILASGSRGGMLGLMAASLFALFKASGRTRVAILAGIVLSSAVIIPLESKQVLDRLMSFSTSRDASDEATESAVIRKQLLLESVVETFKHPLFGVGADQFGTFEGYAKKTDDTSKHLVGWYGTHNSYSAISVENGIPGLLFYLAGVLSPFLLLRRRWRLAKNDPEVASTCLCLSLAWVGFCVAIFFLNFGYFFYLPAFAGLTVGLNKAWGQKPLSKAPVPPTVAAPPQIPAMATATALPSVREGSSQRFRFNGYR